MWLTGQDLSNENETLRPITPDKFFRMLRQADADFANEIEQMRGVFNISPSKAKKMSATLPYIIFCQLNPLNRSTGKMSYTEYFCIDLTVFPKDKDSFNQWRQGIQQDRYVTMAFLSALGDRFHVVFKLRSPCKSLKKFSIFYRVFSNRFLKEHNQKEGLDNSTCDPCRAIPISFDADTFYRIGGALVVQEEFERGEEVEELYKREKDHAEHAQTERKKKEVEKEKGETREPTPHEFNLIKGILKRGIGQTRLIVEKKVKERQDTFSQLETTLKAQLEENGISILEETAKGSVRKIRLQKGSQHANLNAIFNESSWSVTGVAPTPDAQLWIATAKDIIDQFIKQHIYNT